MINIGILTFHRSINYGAFMQAYSLCYRIRSDFPQANVEVIDYSTKHMHRRYSSNYFVRLDSIWRVKKLEGVYDFARRIEYTCKNGISLLLHPEVLKRCAELKKAFAIDMCKLPMSDWHGCSDDFSELFRYMQKYDVVIVGSDCVWEIVSYPFPNGYYMNENSGKFIKMSYAACAQGNASQRLSERQKDYMRKAWSRYAYIGVRDTATEKFVTSVAEQLTCFHNCDPTFLLDLKSLPVSKEQVRQKLEKNGVDFNRPRIIVMGNRHIGKLARTLFGDTHQIVAVYESNSFADVQVLDLTPFEWALCFSFFELTITDKFHGTVFSLKNGIPTLTFDFAAAVNNGDTKISDLYKRLRLEQHYFIGKKEYTDKEKQAIKRNAMEFMASKESAAYRESLEEEAQTYFSFSRVLAQLIDGNIKKPI